MPEQLTDEQLAEWEALADAATPAPWEVGDRWVFTLPLYDDDNRLTDVRGIRFADAERNATERARGQANVEFIAAARTAVPLLVRALRDARDEKAALASAYDALLDRYGDKDAELEVAKEEARGLAHSLGELQQIVRAKAVYVSSAELVAERDALRERLAAVDRLCVEWGDEPWPEGRRSIALISFIGHVRDTLSAADPSRSPSIPVGQEPSQ